MALEMRVYDELTDVDPKIMYGLTFRQLMSVLVMGFLAVIVGLFCWWIGHKEWISWAVIPACVPPAMWGWWKPHGLRAEVWLKQWWRFKSSPRKRLYRNTAIWRADKKEYPLTRVRKKVRNEDVVEEAHR